MNDMLLFILSIIGLAALYWVLFGQKSYQRMFGGEQIEKVETEITKIETPKKKEKKP
jgi:hypothetical protein